MSDLLAQLLRLGLGIAFNPARLMEDAADGARRVTILAVCGLAATFILLPALGCAAAGVWILVQQHLGPVWAAFITAIALALVAILLLLIGLFASRKRGAERHPREEGPAHSPLDSLGALLPALLGLLALPKQAAQAGAAAGRGLFARNKGKLLLAAAVAGLILGQDLFRPGRRRRDR